MKEPAQAVLLHRSLDGGAGVGKSAPAMTKHPMSAVLLSFVALAACQQKQPTVIDSTEDPLKNQIAHAKPVELPPSISATVQFRCKDQSVVTVDFFKGGKQATLHPTKDGEPVHLTAETAGGPYTADGGYTLSGDEKKITWKDAKKPELSCHV